MPIYSTPNARSSDLILVIFASLLVGTGAGIVLAVVDSFWGGVITAILFLLTAVLILLILPRRLEVWPDRLAVVFPAWRWDVPFETVKNVQAAHAFEAYAYVGFRFATAPSKAVVVERVNANLFRRPNIVLSPGDRERFLIEVKARLGG